VALLAVDPPADACWNFGRDEALHSAAADTGGTYLRVYGWSVPTVSFGRNETALGRYDPERLRAVGLTPTRRLTGGRALVHSAELTYAVAAPSAAAPSLRASVDRISQVLVAALRALGIAAELAAAGATAVPVSAGACFGVPSTGELMLRGRKLAGSAQWRDRGALLQHGSILVRDDQALLVHALADGSPPFDLPAAATLASDATVVPTAADFAAAFGAAYGDEFELTVERVASDTLVRADSVRNFAGRYDDPTWVWRR
jgi:lipoate-protein ligase A